MERVPVTPQITLYRFSEHYQVNVLVLQDGEMTILLDTGVQPQGKWLAKELAARGFTIPLIINSHFHPDHVNGNRFFPEAEVWGSANHANNQYPYTRPHRELTGGEERVYGPYSFRFISALGHCSHHLVVVINEQFAYIGDLLMTGFADDLWIPYIAPDGDPGQYLKDIDLVCNLNMPLIPAHGSIMDSPEKIARVAEPYRYYLQRITELGPVCHPEDCLTNPEQVLHSWHQRNLENIFGSATAPD